MTECTQDSLEFESHFSRQVVARFDGGALTSDAGALLLRETDRRIRLSVGFRTGSHTAEAVPLSAEGPGAFLFTGLMDQTDIPFKIAVSLRGDTAEGDKIIQLLRDPRYPQTYGIR